MNPATGAKLAGAFQKGRQRTLIAVQQGFAHRNLGDIGILYAYAPDYFNSGETAHYLAADYGYELAESAGVFEGVSLDLHYGYSFGDYWDEWDIGDYSDYSIGVSASWGRADLSLAWRRKSEQRRLRQRQHLPVHDRHRLRLLI